MKKLVTLLLACLFSFILKSQTVYLQNASFEGTTQPHMPPLPWVGCFDGGTPDTQPGQWGITKPASHGNTYVSFLMTGDSAQTYVEGVTQELESCLTPGFTYTISFDLAHSAVYNTAEPFDCYSSLAIWGGNSAGDKGELLWSSGIITDTAWQTYMTTFIPTNDWCYLSFGPYYITTCTGYVNILLDNIGGDFTDIAENNQTIKTNLYPNPAKSNITISLPYIQGQADMRIYNTAGQLVKTVTNIKQENTVDISNLATGLYYYRILTTDGKTAAGRFVKE